MLYSSLRCTPGSGHHPYTVAYRNPGCSSWPMLCSSFASDLFPLCASVTSVVDWYLSAKFLGDNTQLHTAVPGSKHSPYETRSALDRFRSLQVLSSTEGRVKTQRKSSTKYCCVYRGTLFWEVEHELRSHQPLSFVVCARVPLVFPEKFGSEFVPWGCVACCLHDPGAEFTFCCCLYCCCELRTAAAVSL